MVFQAGRQRLGGAVGIDRMVCQAVLNWSPATETIEQVIAGAFRKLTFAKLIRVPPAAIVTLFAPSLRNAWSTVGVKP